MHKIFCSVVDPFLQCGSFCQRVSGLLFWFGSQAVVICIIYMCIRLLTFPSGAPFPHLQADLPQGESEDPAQQLQVQELQEEGSLGPDGPGYQPGRINIMTDSCFTV